MLDETMENSRSLPEERIRERVVRLFNKVWAELEEIFNIGHEEPQTFPPRTRGRHTDLSHSHPKGPPEPRSHGRTSAGITAP
ncbi:hypothetical protein ILYODFUR_029788 [Ilyodon furcidens]|uniref:Uncharacterized protein n=1 Tax=Ilyodon furcidens TaxID=33524 RepID=A0ABV0U9L0_9TELE